MGEADWSGGGEWFSEIERPERAIGRKADIVIECEMKVGGMNRQPQREIQGFSISVLFVPASPKIHKIIPNKHTRTLPPM